MSQNKVLIIVSSGKENKEKAMIGVRLALALKKNNLSEEVNVFFFGSSERLVAEGDSDLDPLLAELFDQKILPAACKGIAIRDDINVKLLEKRVELDLASSYIARKLDSGFSVLTF